MKLLRDFIRLRTAGRFSFSGRSQAVRRSFTVTVPQPLDKSAARAPIDMHWQLEQNQRRPLSRWHEHHAVDASRTTRHLRLVSSH